MNTKIEHSPQFSDHYGDQVCHACVPAAAIGSPTKLCAFHATAPALLEACKEAELIAALAEFPSSELLEAGHRIGALGIRLRNVIAQMEGS